MWVYMYLQPLHILYVSLDVNVRYVRLHVPTATPHPVGLPGRERTVCVFTCTYSQTHIRYVHVQGDLQDVEWL
jgi:H2-forming N5,N10-methylenetetrahydromethanopterin dehydrogenase-like enzyme